MNAHLTRARAPIVLVATLCAATVGQHVSAARPSGPIAIGMTQSSAIVLRSDGRVISFDTTGKRKPDETFRVPPDFAASDLAVGATAKGPVICLLLNSKGTGKLASFVLQLYPDGKQVWAMLPSRGVYIGIALDAASRYAYVTNSTTNSVHQLEIGSESARAKQLIIPYGAEVLGAVSIDDRSGRLFVGDITGGLFVFRLGSGEELRRLRVQKASEIRAVAWHPTLRRLFVADASQETVRVLDPDDPDDTYEITHRAFRQPAGLSAAADGTMWGVDEGTQTLFQIVASQRVPARVLNLAQFSAEK
jgi:hypothetical protein